MRDARETPVLAQNWRLSVLPRLPRKRSGDALPMRNCDGTMLDNVAVWNSDLAKIWITVLTDRSQVSGERWLERRNEDEDSDPIYSGSRDCWTVRTVGICRSIRRRLS